MLNYCHSLIKTLHFSVWLNFPLLNYIVYCTDVRSGLALRVTASGLLANVLQSRIF